MNWFHPHLVARRAGVARLVIWAGLGLVLVAFFRAQVLSAGRYQLASEQNRLRAVPIPAPRGLIVDRNGEVLAENEPGYAVALIAATEDSLVALLTRIQPMLGLDPASFPDIRARYRRRPSEPVVVQHDVPFEAVSALEERRVLVPGLVIQTTPKRRYSFGSLAAHALGYVSEITEEELASGTVAGARPGTLVGRDGIERTYDDRLRGRDGVRFVEVDALGRTVRDQDVAPGLPPAPGATIRTSIDIALQRFVAETFPAGRRGAVVVLDPRTGELLTLFSAPAYDPNAFIGGIDPDVWQELRRSTEHPLINRTIQAAYPPASPWKLVVAAIALERGAVRLHDHMPSPCRGGLQYYSRYFRCWSVEGHGDVDLFDAIRFSCDVYFYQLGLRLGLETLLQEAGALGMHQAVGIDLPNERTSFFPPSTEYYNRRYGPRGWTPAVTLNLAIGQGENVQTPLNMAYFYALLASSTGRVPPPHLVDVPSGVPVRELRLTEALRADLRMALLAVVESGTAVASRVADLHIAGKTGTAQNPQGADHGWFVAFAPAEAPEVVVAAIVEFAEHGSSVAPMVTRIIARHLRGVEASDWGVPRLLVPDDSAPGSVPIIPGNPTGAGTRTR
ncbi:MAG: penicillin-binding protein 2 [Gemmatimonadota bacterium]|nr:penicillin-binding protein 2 [Gemmatimonadota bacterium]